MLKLIEHMAHIKFEQKNFGENKNENWIETEISVSELTENWIDDFKTVFKKLKLNYVIECC